MEHWSEQRFIHHRTEDQGRRHSGQGFPAAAHRLWEQLCRVIAQSVRAFNTAHPARVSYDQMANGAFMVALATYPSSVVHVVLNLPGRHIRVRQLKRTHAGSPLMGTTMALALDVDEEDKKVVLIYQEAPLSPEEVSHLILSPFREKQP